LGKIRVFLGIFSGGCWFLGVKTGFGGLICRVWANQARKKRSKTFENVRKHSKIFKNIQKHANFRVETFENIQRINGNW
jgi:hypothetical protein